MIFEKTPGFFSMSDIFMLAVYSSLTDWSEAVAIISEDFCLAFSAATLKKRIILIKTLLDIKSTVATTFLKLDLVQIFAAWLFDEFPSQFSQFDVLASIKQTVSASSYQKKWEKNIKRL